MKSVGCFILVGSIFLAVACGGDDSTPGDAGSDGIWWLERVGWLGWDARVVRFGRFGRRDDDRRRLERSRGGCGGFRRRHGRRSGGSGRQHDERVRDVVVDTGADVRDSEYEIPDARTDASDAGPDAQPDASDAHPDAHPDASDAQSDAGDAHADATVTDAQADAPATDASNAPDASGDANDSGLCR